MSTEKKTRVEELAEVGAKWEALEWQEITEDFNAHIAGMKPWEHELIPAVTIEDIMSAPEIGDPKTDLNHDWKNSLPLNLLVKNGDLPDAKKLSDDEVLDIIDTLFIYENQLFKDNTTVTSAVMSCVYAFSRDLTAGNEVFTAYLDAYYMTVMHGLGIIGLSQVSDDDEFPFIEQSIDILKERAGDLTFEKAKTALQAAQGKTKNADLIARIEYRLASLELAERIQNGENEKDNLTLVTNQELALMAVEKVQWKLSGLNRKSDTIATVNKKCFRADCFSWHRLTIPGKLIDPIPFSEAKKAAEDTLAQYNLVFNVFPVKDLISVLFHFETLTALRINLPARALLGLILSRHMGGEAWSHFLMNTFENMGCPAIRNIVEGDEALIKEILQYRLGQGMPPLAQDEKTSITKMKHQVGETLQAFCITVHDLLRCQCQNRAYMNRQIALMFQRNFDILSNALAYDHQLGFATKGAAANQPDVMPQRVFYNLGAIIHNFMYQLYINSSVDLGLVTDGEALPLELLRTNANHDMEQSISFTFFGKDRQIPKQRMKMGNIPGVNPILSHRQNVDIQGTPLGLLDVRTRVERTVSSNMSLIGEVLVRAGLLDVDLPSTSVVPVATVFNTRFGSVFLNSQKPRFVPYENLRAMRDDALTPLMKQEDHRPTKVLEKLQTQLRASLIEIKTGCPDTTSFTTSWFAEAKTTIVANNIATSLIVNNWDNDKDTEENAAELKKKFAISLSHSRFGMLVLSVKSLHN